MPLWEVKHYKQSKTKDHSRQNNSLNFFQRKMNIFLFVSGKGYMLSILTWESDLEQKLNETTRTGSSFLLLGRNKMHLFKVGDISPKVSWVT